MTTRPTVLGLLKRGAKIVVTKSALEKGDTYHVEPYDMQISQRCFNSLRCCLQGADPGLLDGTPQSWVLDADKLPRKWRAPA